MITQAMLDSAGMKRLEFARAMGLPYGTVSAKLGGYVIWQESELKRAKEILGDHMPAEKAGE